MSQPLRTFALGNGRHPSFVQHIPMATTFRNIRQAVAAALRGDEVDLTRIGVRRAIVLLSIPMVIELSMESLFAIVDVFFVGRIGTAAVAAVGLTEGVLILLYSVAWGLSAGVTSVVARRTGEKNAEGAAQAAGAALWIALGISLLLSLPMLVFAEDVLLIMGASEEVLREGGTYARILFGGNLVILFLFVNNAIFRGAGNAAMAMRSLMVSNAINIVLDPLFIFGLGPFPEMGLTGAAVATTIGRGTGICYQLYHLFHGSRGFRILRHHLRFALSVTTTILRVSAGGMGQMLIASASWLFMIRIVAEFGDEVVAGYTIAVRIMIFSLLPSWGVANAAATLVGQNLGADAPDRAARSAWLCGHYNALYMVVVALVFWVLAPALIGLFTVDADVVRHGVDTLRIGCLGYAFFGYGMVLSQAFNGAGDTLTPTWMNVICFWMIEIPLGWSLAKVFGWGSQGVFAAIAISESCLAFLSMYLFRKGKWKLAKV
ncbi:MAG: MATE family efflux transporter [Flavobacteriales bacterium]|nr:MATE family efflux transporter [Flavobacteriales bacterium]